MYYITLFYAFYSIIITYNYRQIHFVTACVNIFTLVRVHAERTSRARTGKTRGGKSARRSVANRCSHRADLLGDISAIRAGPHRRRDICPYVRLECPRVRVRCLDNTRTYIYTHPHACLFIRTAVARNIHTLSVTSGVHECSCVRARA